MESVAKVASLQLSAVSLQLSVPDVPPRPIFRCALNSTRVRHRRLKAWLALVAYFEATEDAGSRMARCS